jgi:hypothetical protein
MNLTKAIPVFLFVALFAFQATAKQRILVYSGKLLDERAAPVGGVFPLTFAIYNKSRGGKALWSEKHFVAVNNGTYAVELGRKKSIPASVDLNRLYVGVRLSNGPELVRERFVAEGLEPETIIRNRGSNVQKQITANSTVDYAEKAGFAYVAERADDSKLFNGMTLDQLKKKLGGSGGGTKVTIGTNTFNAPTAGGNGGTPYQQLCPEGYVVTGLRGGSGLYIDRVGIICSPLESNSKKK